MGVQRTPFPVVRQKIRLVIKKDLVLKVKC